MSRSYRKFPSVKCNWNPIGKKQANRKVRNYAGEISNGNFYKKLYQQYNIVEYRSVKFKEWEIQDWYKDQTDIINGVATWKSKYNISLDETLADWKKFYKCK